MQSQLKAKQKIEIQRSLNNLSNLLSSRSELRPLIQEQVQYLSNDHMQTIHKTLKDSQHSNKQFICSQFNRHKKCPESYRSPYSNNYFPPVDENNIYPSPILRDLEQKGNLLFQQYGRLYFGQDDCVSNFYVYQTQDGLNVAFCLKKEFNDEEMKGVWSSTNVCQIRGDPTKSVTYKLQTSVLYDWKLQLSNDQKDYCKLSGSLKKNKVEAKKLMPEYQIDEFHLMILGKLIEQNQTVLRQQLQSVLLSKSKQICFKNRYQHSREAQQSRIKMGKQFVKMRSQSSKIVQ